MNVYTSYFAMARHIPADIVPISVSAKAPAGFRGIKYGILAPSYDILMEYKASGDRARYVRRYNDEILGKLLQGEVAAHLLTLTGGKDAVLLCYETPADFCHRHLAAYWLSRGGMNVLGEWKKG
jgi:uncharacterized protein (DUF488 family)